MDERLEPFHTKMQKSLNNLEEEFASIRAGRANPHVLDKLKVDYYGTPTSIQSVANVSVPEPRMIQIQPWEKSMVKEIERAIMENRQKLQFEIFAVMRMIPLKNCLKKIFQKMR